MNRSRSFANCGLCDKVGNSEPFYDERNRHQSKHRRVEEVSPRNFNLGFNSCFEDADYVAEEILQR